MSKQDEDARYLDAQRGLPRQRLEALEHVPIQQSGGVQGYGAQSMYSDTARLCFYTLLPKAVDKLFHGMMMPSMRLLKY